MSPRLLTLLLAIALSLPVLAAPAASLAQSAGDDQYVDPFKGEGSGGGGGNGNNSGAQDNSNTGSNDTAAQTTTGSGDTAGASGEAADGSGLPRTGLGLGAVALTGAILLGGGVALRRRGRYPDSPNP
jgi:hypothetical protein